MLRVVINSYKILISVIQTLISSNTKKIANPSILINFALCRKTAIPFEF